MVDPFEEEAKALAQGLTTEQLERRERAWDKHINEGAYGYNPYSDELEQRAQDEFLLGGETYYRNTNGRCADAPCCGCCTI